MKKNILLQPMKLTKKMHDFEIDNNENIFNSFKYIEPKEEEEEKDLMTFEKSSDFLFDILMNDILQTNTVIKGSDKNKNKDKVNPYTEFELKKGKTLPIIDSYELPSLITTRNCLDKKKKKNIPKNIKKLVWTKYIGQEIIRHKCLCCKTVTIENTFFECGHVISERDGGTLEISNLRPICGECNRSMGTMNMIEYIKTYGLFIG
jgi:hypothetical protein